MDRRRRIQSDRADEGFKNNRVVTEPLLRRASKLQNRVSYRWLTVVEDRQVEITSVHSKVIWSHPARHHVTQVHPFSTNEVLKCFEADKFVFIKISSASI